MFGKLGGIGNLTSLMGSLPEIPGKVQQLTERMKEETIHATAGDGAVTVILNGVGQMQSIVILEEYKGHTELEIWIVQASNAAGIEAKQRYAEAISRMASDMNVQIPGLDSLLGSLTGGA